MELARWRVLAAGPGADEGPDVREHLLRPGLGEVVVVEHLEGVPDAAVHGLLHALPGLAQRLAQLQVPVPQNVRLHPSTPPRSSAPQPPTRRRPPPRVSLLLAASRAEPSPRISPPTQQP